jgi:hypothetical protein
MVSCLELSRSSLSVGVNFLSFLRNLQIFLYLNHFLFHLFHHVGSDGNSIHWITPDDWDFSLSTVEGFKRAHLQGFFITVVVGKLYQW